MKSGASDVVDVAGSQTLLAGGRLREFEFDASEKVIFTMSFLRGFIPTGVKSTDDDDGLPPTTSRIRHEHNQPVERKQTMHERQDKIEEQPPGTLPSLPSEQRD